MEFEEVVGIPDAELSSISLNFPVPTLVTALQGARPEIIDKFLDNIRPPWAEMTREMMGKQGNLSGAEVAAARRQITVIIEKSRAK